MVLSDEERKAQKKAYMKEYNARPEVMERKRKYQRVYSTRPKEKVRRKKYDASPKEKARQREYNARPEVRTRQREYDTTPERRMKRKKYDANPERRMKTKELRDDLKIEVYSCYSKIHSDSNIPCCRCCGLNTDIEFLALDHIAGRKEMDSEPELVKLGYSSKMRSFSLLNWVKKNNFPNGF